MLRNQAILLKRMGRLDEALAFYDEQIAAAAKDARSRAYFLNWKANMLFGTGRHDQIIATCHELRAAEKPKTYGWTLATFYLAWSLQNAGRHDEVISVYQDQLAYDREIGGNGASSLLAIARSHNALGHADDERRTLDEVEKVLSAQADRPTKQKEIDGLREALQKARESLLEKSSK
jgi:tetratricopeptide (TPR) repeat protein